MGYKICSHCHEKYSDTQAHCDCITERNNERSRKYYENNKEMKKMLNSKRWKDVRRLVIKRDGGMCNRCLVQMGLIITDELQVHHIKPRSEYPELMFDQDNLITVCKMCNLQLGTNGIDWEIKEFNNDSFEPKL